MERRDFIGGLAGMLLAGNGLGCGAQSPAASSGIEKSISAPLPALPSNPVQILAHYVSWHQKDSENNSWGLVSQHPLFPGPSGYDSRDTSVIAHHNELMREYGITPMLSWWGNKGSAPGRAGDVFLDAWLSVQNTVPAGILYEADGEDRLPRNEFGLIDFDNPAIGNKFVDEINHLHSAYFSKYPERFWRVDGKPVVFLWVSHIFSGQFDKVSARVRDKVYLAGGDWRLFGPLNEDGSFVRPGLDSILNGVDVLTGYGLYQQQFAQGCGEEFNNCYLGRVNFVADQWVDYIKQKFPGKPIWLPMQFTYDDHVVRPEAQNPTLSCSAEQAVALADLWRKRIDASKASGGPEKPIVMLVSWDEFWEGTSVAPSTEFDRKYLNVLRDVLNRK